jgi:hypothetical protein
MGEHRLEARAVMAFPPRRPMHAHTLLDAGFPWGDVGVPERGIVKMALTGCGKTNRWTVEHTRSSAPHRRSTQSLAPRLLLRRDFPRPVKRLLKKIRFSTSAQPPAIAPMTRRGSAAVATAAGSGESGSSSDRSCSQAKNRKNGRRSLVT